MPNGTKGLIEGMSELETDAQHQELSALDRLPWPTDMKDQVWMERVRLRQYCKRQMATYMTFWNDHGVAFGSWFLQLPKSRMARFFQLPRTEVTERLQQQKFHLHASFGTVLCAVTEQVAHYEMTGYPVDGRGAAEIGFEQILAFHKRGGFTIRDDTEETKQKWLIRHQTLGGPKLLERNAKAVDGDSSDDDEEGDPDEGPQGQVDLGTEDAPSFRSDRRIVRLLIARCFADALQSAFLKEIGNNNDAPIST